MRSLALIVLVTGALFHAAEAQEAQDALQGDWRIVALQDGGRTAPAEALEGAEWVITENLIVQKAGGQTLELSYTVDPSKAPMWIDLKAEGRTMLGITKLEGDTLTVCFSESHGAERSTAFESQPDSVNDVLIVLRREQP